MKLILEFSKNFGLQGLFSSFLADLCLINNNRCGYELAVATLQYSMIPGKHSETHTQHDIIRKLRLVYGNWIRLTPNHDQNDFILSNAEDKVTRLTETSSCSAQDVTQF